MIWRRQRDAIDDNQLFGAKNLFLIFYHFFQHIFCIVQFTRFYNTTRVVSFSSPIMLPLSTFDDSSSTTTDDDDVVVLCALDRLNVLLEKESKPAYFSPFPTNCSNTDSINSFPGVYTLFQGAFSSFEVDGHKIRLKCIDWIFGLQHHFRKSSKISHVAINYLDRFLCSNKQKDISNIFLNSSVDILTLLTTMAFDCAIRIHSEDSGDGVRSAYDCAERELGVNPLHQCDEEKHKIKRSLIRKKLESTTYYNRDGFHSLLDAYQDIVEVNYSHSVDIPSVEDCSAVQHVMMVALDWFLDPPLASGYADEMMCVVSPTIDAIVKTRHFIDGCYDKLREDITGMVNIQLSSFLRYGMKIPHEGPFIIAYAAMINAFDLALSSPTSSSDRDAKETLSCRLESHCRNTMNKAFNNEKSYNILLKTYNGLDLNWKNAIQSQGHIKSDRLGQVANVLFYLYQRQMTQVMDWTDNVGCDFHSKHGICVYPSDLPVGCEKIPTPKSSCFIPNTHEHNEEDVEIDCFFHDSDFLNGKFISDNVPSVVWTDESDSASNTSILDEDHCPHFPIFNSSLLNFSEMIPNDCKHRVVNSSYANVL